MKRLINKNLIKGKVPNKPGLYHLYNRFGTKIYIGSSKILRHRLQSYRQEDCFVEHPTKRVLRGKAHFFTYRLMPLRRAKRIDKVKKFRYNSH